MIRVLTAALAAATAGAAQQLDPDVAYVQFADGQVRDVAFGDLDADGQPDLVVSVYRDGARHLSVHLHRGARPAYRSAPDRELALVRDVVAFAVADVVAAPGAELVLFSPTRAVAVHWLQDAPEPRYTLLASIELLWQPAKPDQAFAWQHGVADLDADGLDDLLVAELGGYRALVQRRAEDGAVSWVESRLRAPAEPLSDRRRSELRFRDRSQNVRGAVDFDDQRQRGFLLEIWDTLAAPQLGDWNADGALDVVALVGQRLAVWIQGEGGRFAEAPDELHEVPERGIPLFDPSLSVQLVDIERDGRAEVVIVSGRTGDDAISSVVELFRQGGEGDLFESAADKMLIQGFTNAPSFDDVDGDGVADMAIGSLRTDVIDTLTAGSSGTVDAQLNLFVGRSAADGGRFRRPVAMVHHVSLEGRALRKHEGMLTRFLRDLDGDGLRELFMRTNREEIVVLPTITRGRGFEVGDPIWRFRTEKDAPIRVIERADALSLVVLERQQVAHVELR